MLYRVIGRLKRSLQGMFRKQQKADTLLKPNQHVTYASTNAWHVF